MSRLIYCVKLQKETEGLSRKPYPGELGDKIFETISAEAWSLWLEHQTMLINENRLILTDAKARSYLVGEMENFLFGAGSDKPDGYSPESA